MSLATNPTFDAATVVALKMLNDTRRMEIRFVDDAGIEQVVSLPVQAALELALELERIGRELRGAAEPAD